MVLKDGSNRYKNAHILKLQRTHVDHNVVSIIQNISGKPYKPHSVLYLSREKLAFIHPIIKISCFDTCLSTLSDLHIPAKNMAVFRGAE